MSDRNLEIALLVRAELAAARGQIDDLNRAIDRSGTSSAKAQRATRDQANELTKLIGQIDPTVASLDRLDRLQQRLQAAKLKGFVDDDGFARFNTLIEQQRAGLDKSSASMHGLNLNTQATRMELGRLLKDMATGQWDRFGSTSLTLANYSGVMSKLFTPVGLGVASAAVAVAGLTAAAIEGYQEQERLARSILLTGNYAGTTTGQVNVLANALGTINGRGGAARDILNGLIDSGRVSGAALNDVGRAAVNMAAISGDSAKQVVTEWAKIADDPVKGVIELDQRFHFLNTTTFQHIQDLQQAGDKYGALRIAAAAFADDTAAKMDKLRDSMGWLERGIDNWKRNFDALKTAALDLGKPETEIDRFQAALDKYNKTYDAYKRSKTAGSSPDYQDQLFAQSQSAYAELVAARDAAQQAKTSAAAEGLSKQVQTEGNAAAERIDKLSLSLDRAKQRQQALNEAAADLYKVHLAGGKLPDGINFDGAAADAPQGAGWDRLKAEIEKRYADPKSPKVKDTTNQLAEAQKALQDQILSLGNSALGPVSAIWDRYTKSMLAAAAAGGKAIRAGGDPSQVRGQVSQIQDLASTARDKALADQQRGLNIALAQATGDQATASRLQIEAQYGDLLADLQRRGDAAGVDLVNRLINVSQAQARLQELQQVVQLAFAEQQRQEQSIQAQQNAGLLTEIDARQQIVALHQQTAEKVQTLIPEMQQLAQAIGSPQALNGVKTIQAQVQQLQLTTNIWRTTLQSGIEQGLNTVYDDIVNRTKNLRGMVLDLISDVARGFARIAIQDLSQRATQGIMSLLGQQASDAGGAAATSAAIATAGAGAATAMGGAITSAGLAAAQAMATAIASAGAANGASSSASSWMSLFSSAGSSGGGGFATGGPIRGAGTATSDSIGIWASDGEFMQRAAAVNYYGLDFMHAVNNLQFPRRGYATGGYISAFDNAPSAPTFGSPSMPRISTRSSSAVINNRMRVYMVQNEDELMQRLASHPRMEKAVVMYAGQNGNAIKAEW